MMWSWLNAGEIVRIMLNGGRMAMVIATGGHFATTVAAARIRKSGLRSAKSVQVVSVYIPLPEMVAKLNQFRPAMVAAYASIAKLLAGEQEAGRLRIEPVLLSLTAEGLPAKEYGRIAKAFKTKVRNGYAANECPFLSYGCEYGWLHVNSDWLVFEPVDVHYRPVLPGTQSHTVLLSNLANRVQPILRYDLGDSILQSPDPCPCGNPLPAIRVQGRATDVLTFPSDGEEQVTIAPLVLGTLIEGIPGIEQFQLIQKTPTSLRVRLRVDARADQDRVWSDVHSAITDLLSKRKLDHVAVEHAEEPPEQSPGGKYRTVIPLS
jgi:phenylacetate-coenzyme A ligase PaaK-like adenylate-forming protein